LNAIKNVLRLIWQVAFILIVIPLLWICEPFIRIRLGYISNQRIGHMTVNTEIFLRRKLLFGWPRRTLYLFTTADPANRQMMKMYKRQLHIFESRFLSHVYFACRDILQKTRFYQPITWSMKDKTPQTIAVINDPVQTVSFTRDEEAQGRALLERMGLGADDWYACFHARDNAYFYKWRPQLAEHWEKTKLRNADIEDFRGAMNEVTEAGGFALRVGAVVDAPFDNQGNARIIDYATHHRSDFGDIYLSSKCRFFLASNSGIVNIPMVFNKPVAIVNLIPLSAVVYRAYDLFIPKTVVETESNRIVPYPELLPLGLFERERAQNTEATLAANGLQMRNNTPDEIRELCQDMLDAQNGIVPPPDVRELQLEYQRRFHNYYGVDTGLGFIGPRFARKYAHLITATASEGTATSRTA